MKSTIMLKDLLDLFIGFTRATFLGFGGGPSTVPLYQHEAVDVYKWMSQDEFGQALAFGNALPGPIATKLTMFVGYKVAGWAGAFVSLVATTIPIGIIMIALYALLNKFKDSPYLKGAVSGVRPVIFVMLAMMAFDFSKYTFTKAAGPLSWVPFAIAAIYYVSVQYFHLSQGFGVLAALVVGALFLR
ncbi:MAG: chromate efflux transporter [Symbiobacteriaceae bacterium]|jgi:chromate transporter|nr:chromate efflux transporter [Symbiobacteriaceae bacterium]